MALRNQPYLPLYIQDYLTDEKLNECSASTQGVYIKIMCVMHKSDEYGTILLKQKDKQNESKCLNFATKLSRLLPFTIDEINDAVCELVDEGVLIVDGDKLVQKRMVKDNALSNVRSESGKKGAFAKANAKAKPSAKQLANSESEYEDEIESELNNAFGIFWESYHSITTKPKTDKEAALKYFSKLSPEERQKAIDQIKPYADSIEDKRYCKKARTYLADKNFNDEFAAVRPKYKKLNG